MARIISFLAAVFLAVPASGQTPRMLLIDSAEYFINTDPGEGTGIRIPISFGYTVDVLQRSIVASTGDRVFVRVKNERGVWSAPYGILNAGKSQIRGQLITRAGYFIDADSGFGKGLKLNITSISDSGAILFASKIQPPAPTSRYFMRVRTDGMQESVPVGLRLKNNAITAARAIFQVWSLDSLNNKTLRLDTVDMALKDSLTWGLVRTASLNRQKSTVNQGDTIYIQMKGKNEIWGPAYRYLAYSESAAKTTTAAEHPQLTLFPSNSRFPAIRYLLPERMRVTLRLSDIKARSIAAPVVNQIQQAGMHTATLAGCHLPFGMYLCTLQAGDRMLRRLVLIR
jgi:hypothetical protein